MNWLDAIIIAVLIFYLIDGYRRGFIEILIEFISFFIAVIVAIKFDQAVGKLIISWISIPVTFQRPIGFLTTWLFIQIIISVLLHIGYKFIPSPYKKSKANKIAGILPSFAKGLLLLAIFLVLIMTLPLQGSLKATVANSKLGSVIVDRSAGFENGLNKIFGDAINRSITFMTVKPPNQETATSLKPSTKILKPDERMMLGFKTVDVKIDPYSENKMYILLNNERVKNGLPALERDDDLALVAREHAKDMFAKGYFSHVNLEGLSPFDRMKNAGIEYRFAGENLALAPTVDLAHSGLMSSPGHRANILEPKFGRIGIGVIDGGIYGKMFVQEFRD